MLERLGSCFHGNSRNNSSYSHPLFLLGDSIVDYIYVHIIVMILNIIIIFSAIFLFFIFFLIFFLFLLSSGSQSAGIQHIKVPTK